MRTLMLIAATVMVASCSRPATPPQATFAEQIAGRVAGPPQTCISTNSAENLRALDPQTIAYGTGRTIWINHLPGPCPGLSEFNTLIVEASTGGEYCRGDRVRGREPGAIIAGPSCNFSDWVPYRKP